MPNTTDKLIDESNPTRVAGSPADTSVPGWSESRSAAQAVGEALFKSPRYTSAIESKDASIRELFEYDKRLEASGGTSPTGEAAKTMYGPGYVSHYGDVMRGASGYARGMGGVISTGQSAIKEAGERYESAMTSVLDKFLDFFKLKETRKTKKEDRLFDVLKETGGDWLDPDTGQIYHLPTPEEKEKIKSGYTSPTGTTLLIEEKEKIKNEAMADIRNRITPRDLATKFGDLVEDYELISWYNSSSPWGPMKESPDEFRKFKEKTTELSREMIDYYAADIANEETKTELKDIPEEYQEAVVKKLQESPPAEQKTGFWESLMTKLRGGGGSSSTPAPSPIPSGLAPDQNQIRQAQDSINKAGDRQATYNQILNSHPHLRGYIHP